LEEILFFARRFVSNRRGNMAVTFALSLLPLAVVIGGAIEIGAAESSKTRLSDALDAALLAGAASLSTSDDLARTTAASYLSRNASGTENLRYSFEVKDEVLFGGQGYIYDCLSWLDWNSEHSYQSQCCCNGWSKSWRYGAGHRSRCQRVNEQFHSLAPVINHRATGYDLPR
jgi:hypothetical protein